MGPGGCDFNSLASRLDRPFRRGHRHIYRGNVVRLWSMTTGQLGLRFEAAKGATGD